MKKSQIVTKEKRVIFLSLVLFMPIMLYPANSYEAGDPLADYLEQKALSNCEKAMEIIEDWTLYLDDPLIIETNIFRINELIKYPELIENAINAYKNMLGNKAVQDNPVLKARVNIFLNMLYLRKGRVQEALSVKNGLGFIGRYMIAGPLRNSADFSKPFIPETDYCGDYPDKAKADNAKCFEALPDLTGRIDMNDLLGDISDPVFYLKAEVIVPDDGSYSLWLAKTGYTDIWMDGNRVFSNRKKHDFTFDQYRLEFSLSKGRHVLLIKAGGSRSGAMLALRFTDDKGNAISEDVKSETGIETKANAYSSLTGISLFNAMERILNKKPAEGEPAFYAAYLYYVSGLNSEEDKEAVKLFSKAKESGEFCSVSNYYLGLLEKDRAKKDIYFNESINASKKNAESLKEIADIKLQDNLLYEIYPIIDKLAEINPGSFLNNKLKAQAFMLAGWHSEALKEASLLKDNGVKSCGYEIESLAYIKDERYKEALNACKHLYEADRYNMKSLNDLIECCLKTGRYDYADSLLSQSAELYPNNVLLRLKHAGLIKNTKDARACLPYLLCAKKISPYHKEVLLNIGMVYHKLEKDELALEYLRAALQRDPKEDIRIKEYIRIITPPNPPEGGFLSVSPTQSQGEASHGDLGGEGYEPANFISLESKIFKSPPKGWGGDDLFDNTEKLLLSSPAEPESILYYYDIIRLADICGFERAYNILQKLISSVNSISSFEKKNLHLMALKLELEKLLYRFNKPEAKKLSEEFFPVRRWSLLGPYSRYGPGDMDYPFMPEIITNFKNSDIKKKEVLIQDAKGEIDFAKYLYPEKGIAYAVSTISCDKPVKIRIYSSSPYKLFINGKETIKNLKGDIFRTRRIVKAWGSSKITLMIKLYMNGEGDDLRILVTDDNDKILNIDSDPSEIVFNDFRFLEEMDYPYNYFADIVLNKTDKDKKDANFRLGRYFHELGSAEAIKFYRKAIADDPVKSFYLAKALMESSDNDNGSALYKEALNIIENLAKKCPDFIPGQQMRLKKLIDAGSLYSAYAEYRKFLKGSENYLPLRLDYAGLLLRAEYEKEFEQETSLLINKFPYSIQPLQILAAYYKDRNIFKSIEIYKTILLRESSPDALKNLIRVFREQGNHGEIKAFIKAYDAAGIFKKELIKSLMDSGDYDTAKKAVFRELTQKNDPDYNIMLGTINYHAGSDPAMYWQKALYVNPSNYMLRDFLGYIASGRIENPFKEYLNDNIDKDIASKDAGHNKNEPSHASKKSMIFVLDKDGGSRLFCEDVISSDDPEAVNKRPGYSVPFRGEIHPVHHRIYKDAGGKGSIARISYYINDPVARPRGSIFFAIPYIKIDLNEQLSCFMLKVVAPQDMKIKFSFSREFEVKSVISGDRIIYTIDLNNLKAIDPAENGKPVYFSFSGMNDIKDFVLWYTGQLRGAFNIEMEGLMPRFAGKKSNELIKAVHDFVAHEIKLRDNVLYSPHKAMDTLFNKSGTAEDKTILAASMLAELGIKPYIAFADARDYFRDDSFILPGIFATNILLYVPLDVKTGLWLDFSDTQYKFGAVNESLTGKDAVIIIKDGYEIKKIGDQ